MDEGARETIKRGAEPNRSSAQHGQILERSL